MIGARFTIVNPRSLETPLSAQIVHAWAALCRALDNAEPMTAAELDARLAEFHGGAFATYERDLEIIPDRGDFLALERPASDPRDVESVDVEIVATRIATCGRLEDDGDEAERPRVHFLCRRAPWSPWAEVSRVAGRDHFGDETP